MTADESKIADAAFKAQRHTSDDFDLMMAMRHGDRKSLARSRRAIADALATIDAALEETA